MAPSVYPSDAPVCRHCGQPIPRRSRPSGKLEGLGSWRKRQFCSRLCAARWQSEERHYEWKGDAALPITKRRRAQRRYRLPNLCQECCDAPAVDRHHLDGDTGNNVPDNLRFVCRRCHQRLDGRLDAFVARNQSRERPIITCLNCGAIRLHRAKGLCQPCYQYQRLQNIAPTACRHCGKIRLVQAKGLCHACYEYERRNGHLRHIP
jgi:hypothetical protein